MYARNENKIERLNKRMLRVVCNDRVSTYSELLVQAKRTTMHCNRRKALAELVFNVLHNLSPPLPRNLFTKQICMYDMRYNYMLVQPRFRTMKQGYKSIAYQAKLWNSLPCIKVLDNYTSFKLELAKWVAIECKGGTCFACKF